MSVGLVVAHPLSAPRHSARVASSLGVDLDVKAMTEFTLMHEFTREHNFFGWHVDSSPGDGKPPRTLNVNVMLSAVGVDREHRGREKASDHAPVWVKLRE